MARPGRFPGIGAGTSLIDQSTCVMSNGNDAGELRNRNLNERQADRRCFEERAKSLRRDWR
jgi:hypothetical protein